MNSNEIECIFNANDLVLFLKKYLDVYFNNRKWNGISLKNVADSDSFSMSVPKVYPFLCPPDEIAESGYPQAVPSVTIVINSITPTLRQDQVVSISFHTAVYNPSTSEKETAEKTGENEYTLKDGQDYTSSQAQLDLYTTSLSLAQTVMEYLIGLAGKGLRITDCTVQPPSIGLEDFPYSTAVVNCNIQITQLLYNTNSISEYRNKIINLL